MIANSPGVASVEGTPLIGPLDAQFQELDAELDQLRQLITSTASTLSVSFSGLQPHAQEAPPLGDTLREHLTTGLVTLQFEDIAGQLIEHVRRRKSALHELVGRLTEIVERCHEPAELRAELAAIRIDAESLFTTLSHKAVQQTSMDTGDVELF